MTGFSFPTLRIDLEGVRLSLNHAFASYHHDIEEYIDKELKNFIDNFDFKRVIERDMGWMLERIVADTIRTHFINGPGADVIKQELARVLEKRKPQVWES